jgi:hypothetical protein
MSTHTAGEVLDSLHNVLGLVVDKIVDAVALDERSLVLSRVDADDSVASGDGVLCKGEQGGA